MFRTTGPAPDTRPAMMSVAALMVLLLPILLMVTSSQKLTGLPLGVPGPTEELPPEPPGPVERLEVRRTTSGFRVSAEMRNTDVLAQAGDTEHKEFEVADLANLREVLLTIKSLDPKRERVTLVPLPDSTTDEVVHWMDVVRQGPSAPLFPRVILVTAEGG